MTIPIELRPEEERALLERARLSGRDPVQYAQQIIRDHLGTPAPETTREEVAGARPTLDDFIDHEFVAYCERESDESVTLEEVLEATSKIKDSMARVIIEEERADRF
jgi:hypothetical protein